MNNKILSATDNNQKVEDFISFERNKRNKNEFYNGKIIASKSSSRRHSLIGSNITIALGSRLRRHRCEIYNSNMNVKLSENDFSYPDVVIVKGDPKFCGKEFDVLTNPTIVIEILSEKTLFEDKTKKLEKYLAMKSVQEYLLVDEGKMRVEHYSKQNEKQFMYRIYTEEDEMVSLDSIECKANLSELYAKIKY